MEMCSYYYPIYVYWCNLIPKFKFSSLLLLPTYAREGAYHVQDWH